MEGRIDHNVKPAIITKEIVLQGLQRLDAACGEVNDNIRFLRLYSDVSFLLGYIKDTKKKLDEAGIKYMTTEGIKKIEFGDGRSLLMGFKKENRYDTNGVYDALEFTEEQRRVLPKNPKFKKTAILNNDKTCHCHYEDERGFLEVKVVDEAFLPPKKEATNGSAPA